MTKEMSCDDMQCNEMEILYLCMCTPQKINMKPKITLIEKDNHLLSTSICVFQALIFQGVCFYVCMYARVFLMKLKDDMSFARDD